MRIYDTNQQASSVGSSAAQQASRTEAASSARAAAAGAKGSARADQVQLSAVGSGLRAAESDPAARNSKVAALAAMYQAGTYQVDSGAVSGRIVDDAISAH